MAAPLLFRMLKRGVAHDAHQTEEDRVMKLFAAKSLAAAAGIAVVCGPVQAVAQDKVILKFGHILPANHYIAEHNIKVLAQSVEERTGGAVSFEIYPASQLGKDVPALLQSGVLDIAAISVSQYPEKFPLSSVAELPGQFSTACVGSQAAMPLLEDGALLDRVEFQPAGVQVLSAGALPPYPFFGKGKRVNTVADFAGIKTWVNGPAMERTVAVLGGVPIKIASPELYEAASRGTLDAMMFPYAGMFQYDLNNLVEFTIEDIYMGTGMFVIGISDASLGKLSEEQKQILMDEAIKVQDSFCAWADNNADELKAQLAAQDGFEVIRFSEADHAAFREKTGSVADEWAAGMEATGKPGREVLEAYRAELAR